MNEEISFVPVTCAVELRRGTGLARLTFRGEEKEFMTNISLNDGALVMLYLEHFHIDLSPESENLAGANAAMIFFAREYSKRFGGSFLRTKITHDNQKRICLFLENENSQIFKFSLVTGLILAIQTKATLLLDEALLAEEKLPEEDGDILGLD